MPTLRDTTREQLSRNLTPEVRQYWADRIRELDERAASWPLRVAISHVGKRPDAKDDPLKPGTRVVNLLCWHGERIHCGQSVSQLASGQALYEVTVLGILDGIRAHVAQCHSKEDVKDGCNAPDEAA
jgi:hypothetical protein